MQIYPPRPRRRLPVAQPAPTVDRYALGIAVLSALTFAATLTLMCAVFALGAVVLRTETRWAELAGLLGAAPPMVSPLVTPTAPTAFASELPTASPNIPMESAPTPTLPPEPTLAAVVDSPLATPIPELAATPTETVAAVPPPGQSLPPEDLAIQLVLLQKADSVSAALNTLVSLLAAPVPDDLNWQSQATTQVNLIRQTYNELFSLAPPPALSTAYGALLTATNNCLTGLYTIEAAFPQNDLAALQQGMAELNACLPELANATSQLRSG